MRVTNFRLFLGEDEAVEDWDLQERIGNKVQELSPNARVGTCIETINEDQDATGVQQALIDEWFNDESTKLCGCGFSKESRRVMSNFFPDKLAVRR
jgi:hypothetical protein